MQRRFPAVAALALTMALTPKLVMAQSTSWVGGAGSAGTNWNEIGNWSSGVPNSGTQVFIDTIAVAPTVLGVSGTTSATAGNTWVGYNGVGDLTIQNGYTLTTTGVGRVGSNSTSNGSVTVTGQGSEWAMNQTLIVGVDGSGALTISDNGTVSQTQPNVPGSGYTVIGGRSFGTLLVESGGSLISAGDGFIGGLSPGDSGVGHVTTTGTNSAGTPSLWSVTGQLHVGYAGTGTLDLESSGLVVAEKGTIVANLSTSTGILTVTGGTLQTLSLAAGTGTAQVNFDGGTLSATADNANFITNFSGTQLNIGSGGLTIDDAGHAIGNDATSVFTGGGGLTKMGSGTFTLLGTNTYSGPTAINNGTLQLDGSIASSATVNSAGTLSGIGSVFGGVSNFGNVMPGDGGPSGALTITGAYVGNGGRLTINSVLGDDASPTAQLALSGPTASASGNTNVVVNNVGGAGAQTTGAGIAVVVASGGATTLPTAFRLAPGTVVAAGPFQYLLFRGGNGGDSNSWYLRSHCDEAFCPELGPDPAPFYRPETSIYGALPGMARSLGIASVGTFHERYGDQNAVRSAGGRAWGRVFGEHNEQGASGELDTRFEGWLGGVQLGIDAFRWRGDDGSQDAGGVFVTIAKADGDVNGNAIGVANTYAGSSDISGNGVGAYYTHIGPGDWYLDSLAMVTFYEADGMTTNNVATNVGGSGAFLSLEGGVPIALGLGVSLEGQGQLIYQHLDFGGTTDPFSTVGFDTADALTGRLGLRLAAFDGAAYRPYLKANIWQDWSGTDRTIYANTHVLSSKDNSTALEVGGGVVGEVSQTVSWWGVVDYTTDVAGNDLEVVRGNLGVKVGW